LNQNFSTYGLTPVIYGNDTISKTDLIRRRWLDNNFYGAIFSLTYNNLKNFKLIVGGGANQYDGKHFGEIIWARTASQSEINQHYYDNKANKFEASAYAKANYQIKRVNFFVDLQIRHIGYKYNGNDQYYADLIPLTQNVAFTFFNPKLGLSFDLNSKNNFYASFSVATREPVRDDFVQSSIYSRPKPEQLQNLEVGYRFHARKLFVNANYYLMNYKDQLILTGQINDVGAYNRANVAKSYRSGIEIESGYLITSKISLTGNFTLSANKIQNFTEYIDNYDNYDANGNMIQTVIQHSNTDIAFSPNVIAALGIQYEPIKNLKLTWQSKYVGKQYLDNTSNDRKSIDAYFTNNLMVNYSIKIKGIREMNVGILANNILNELYENNGYTFGYISGGKRINENYYFPQAGRNFLLRLTIKI
jgi:iron complex outermembrane receptor protein